MVQRVFINYRRDDTVEVARRLKADLERELPTASVYLDLASNEGGENYRAKINTEIAACNVFISLIGPRWLEVAEPDGRARLHMPGDLVCEEIDSALDQGKVVLPLLVDGARMPGRTELPDTIKRLARQHALPITSTSREAETRKIAAQIAKLAASQSPITSWRKRLLNLLAQPLAAAAFVAIGYLGAVNFPTSTLIKQADLFGRWDAFHTADQKLGMIEELRHERNKARDALNAAQRELDAVRRELALLKGTTPAGGDHIEPIPRKGLCRFSLGLLGCG